MRRRRRWARLLGRRRSGGEASGHVEVRRCRWRRGPDLGTIEEHRPRRPREGRLLRAGLLSGGSPASGKQRSGECNGDYAWQQRRPVSSAGESMKRMTAAARWPQHPRRSSTPWAVHRRRDVGDRPHRRSPTALTSPASGTAIESVPSTIATGVAAREQSVSTWPAAPPATRVTQPPRHSRQRLRKGARTHLLPVGPNEIRKLKACLCLSIIAGRVPPQPSVLSGPGSGLRH